MENIFDFLRDSCISYPSSNYVYDKKYYTYKEVYDHVGKMQKILMKKGIKKNDRVLLYLENSIEYIIAFFSVLKTGATVVPITITSTAETIMDIVDECEPPLILTSSTLHKKIENIVQNQKEIIYTVDLPAICSDVETAEEMIITGELAMIIYTSGTTAKSKGVMLSHKNLIENTLSILDYLKLNNSDSILVTLPFTYSYGNSVFLTHTKAGGFLHIYREGNFPQLILSSIAKGDFTGFSTVGSFLKLLMTQENFEPSMLEGLQYLTLAGEQSSKDYVASLHEMLPKLKIFIMYGQTEAGARLSYLEPEYITEKLGSVGKAIKGVSIRIVDEDGNEAKAGEKGEITASGLNIMQGYWKKPEETEKVLKNAWLHTGDVAYKDPEGFIYIVGRKNDIIKYLGHRISPLEIESHINNCENVLESAVVADYDEEENVRIAAYIVQKEKGGNLSELTKELRKVLPSFKIPAVFYPIDELPRTSNGKIKRSGFNESHIN